MVLHQSIPPAYFVGDEPAKQAVKEMANPVARYAEMTRRLHEASFATPMAKAALYRDAVELRSLIIARARSGGIVDHELETFWEAAQVAARARFGKVDIYPLPSRVDVVPSAAPKKRRSFIGRGRG
ncbi:hypothetical protein [Sphingomonas abietis]|uniref:Uncharacterized protein n=1 Tax=Sphingomonas abietis TaxID=3012344 RepID=A0ABY7NS17_9SPHN|nr:hypothetical protein [Sphingomonas abietis]WBO23972.1 hypothetical protein PBT88_07635 [Sphingomonas abietis]